MSEISTYNLIALKHLIAATLRLMLRLNLEGDMLTIYTEIKAELSDRGHTTTQAQVSIEVIQPLPSVIVASWGDSEVRQ